MRPRCPPRPGTSQRCMPHRTCCRRSRTLDRWSCRYSLRWSEPRRMFLAHHTSQWDEGRRYRQHIHGCACMCLPKRLRLPRHHRSEWRNRAPESNHPSRRSRRPRCHRQRERFRQSWEELRPKLRPIACRYPTLRRRLQRGYPFHRQEPTSRQPSRQAIVRSYVLQKSPRRYQRVPGRTWKIGRSVRGE